MKTGVQSQKTDAPIYIFLFITHIVVIACQEVLYEKLPRMEKKKRYKFRNAFVTHTVSFIVTSVFKRLKEKRSCRGHKRGEVA